MLKPILTALIVWPGISGAAMALSIAVPTCGDDDGTVYWHSIRYDTDLVATVVNTPKLDEQGLQKVALVACGAQRQVMATVSNTGYEVYEINTIFEAAVLDTATHTFADVAGAIREIGYDASVTNFDNNTCLCDADVLERLDTFIGIEVN